MVDTLVLDTLTLGTNTNFPLAEVAGLETIAIRTPSEDLPGQHGAYVPNQLYGARRIVVAGRVKGSTQAAYLTNRQSLQAAMKISRDASSVLVPIIAKFNMVGGGAYQAAVIPTKAPDMSFKPGHLTFEEFVFELEAPDPALYSQTLTSSVISLPAGGGTALPTAIPVILSAGTGGTALLTNAGNLETWPTVRFDGPLTTPTIFNSTLGITLQLSLTLLAGEYVVVDMKTRTITQGTSTNKMNALATGSDFFWLKTGDNTVNFSALAGSGTATVTFRSAYLGV